MFTLAMPQSLHPLPQHPSTLELRTEVEHLSRSERALYGLAQPDLGRFSLLLGKSKLGAIRAPLLKSTFPPRPVFLKVVKELRQNFGTFVLKAVQQLGLPQNLRRRNSEGNRSCPHLLPFLLEVVLLVHGATLNSTPCASGRSVPQLIVQVWRRM